MADFSLTTLFVVPVGNTLPSSGSTQNLLPGQVGFFRNDYTVANAGNIAAAPYFYIAQGRSNTYLQGSKRSDKISGGSLVLSGNAQTVRSAGSNVTEWYKTVGSATVLNQVSEIANWDVKCGDIITLTIRAHSSYIDTLYFNGLTRSVTIQAPCCECGEDPCTEVDAEGIVDALIVKLTQTAPDFLGGGTTGTNPDNIILTNFFTFTKSGTGAAAKLVITGKALNKYGQPCDVAAFPWEYDRLWFRTFVYAGPATTADFIVADSCNIVATSTITQNSTFPKGTSDEIIQLEKNYYSYQAGYLKHLYRMVGYNENFESWVSSGAVYDTFTIKFNELDRSAYQWGDYVQQDSIVILAVPNTLTAVIEPILTAALGAPTVV